ncbi:hypothetical protein D3C72_2182620 [compost metagenome]
MRVIRAAMKSLAAWGPRRRPEVVITITNPEMKKKISTPAQPHSLASAKPPGVHPKFLMVAAEW